MEILYVKNNVLLHDIIRRLYVVNLGNKNIIYITNE